MKDNSVLPDRKSIRELLKTATENKVPGADFELDLHERHLKAQNRKHNAKKKARKVAKRSRRANR